MSSSREYRLNILVTGRDQGARSMLGGLGDSLGSIGRIAAGILSAQAFVWLGRQVLDFAKNAITATAAVQQMQVGLEALTARELFRSGQFDNMNSALAAAGPLAKDLMDELARIAILSPYQLKNVQTTFRQAMAFGFTTQEAKTLTKALLDMAAGVGADNVMLDRMAYNLAQIRLQGKVTALDIRQLAMAGLDLNDVLRYVGKQMGVNIEDHEDFNQALKQGKISWEDFTTYFAQYADENFGGAAERMSRTLMGLKSTFADLFQLTMPAILGPAADKIGGFLSDILDHFLAIRDSGDLEAWGESLGNWIDGVLPSADEFIKQLEDIWFNIEGIWGVFRTAFITNDWSHVFKMGGQGALELSRAFRNWVSQVDWEGISEDLADGIRSVDWSLLGEQVYDFAGNIWNGLAEAASEINWGDIASAVGVGFMDFMAGLTGQESWENVKLTWTNNVIQLGQIITKAFEGMQKDALIKTTNLGMTISSGFTSALGGIAALISGALPAVTGAIGSWLPSIDKNLDLIKKMFFNKFQGAMQQAVRALEGMRGTLLESLNTLMSEIMSAVHDVTFSIHVNTPNWNKLIADAIAGMAELSAITQGGTAQGGSKRHVRPGGGSLGGGTAQANAVGGLVTGILGGLAIVKPARGEGLASIGVGEQIIPAGGMVPAGPAGNIFNFTLVYSPAVSTLSQHEAMDVLGPMVREAMREEFRKRGS